MVHHNGGWTPELIEEVAMPMLKNRFMEAGDSRKVHPGLPLD
jgi:hypothetical protein